MMMMMMNVGIYWWLLTMGDWSDCWLRVSAVEKHSLASFLDESELIRDLDRRTSGVDERFLFTSPISSGHTQRIKKPSDVSSCTVQLPSEYMYMSQQMWSEGLTAENIKFIIFCDVTLYRYVPYSGDCNLGWWYLYSLGLRLNWCEYKYCSYVNKERVKMWFSNLRIG
jgi:hypothetical protein